MPGIRNNSIADHQINAIKRSNYRNRRRHYYESFKGGLAPLPYALSATGIPTMPTSAVGQGTTVHYLTPAGQYLQLFTTTAQAILPFPLAGTGLEISGDEVDNESLEIVIGGNANDAPFAFKVGTDPSFFLRAKFKITDADGSDQFGIFFRKVQAFGVPTSFLTTGDPIYTDIFLFGFAATVANPNIVRWSYDLNNGGSATVGSSAFAWADGLVHRLEIRVVGRAVQLRINGVPLGGSIALDADGGAITAQATNPGPAFSFDTGDWVVGGIFLRQDAAVAEDTYLVDWEIGHLSEIGEDKGNV